MALRGGSMEYKELVFKIDEMDTKRKYNAVLDRLNKAVKFYDDKKVSDADKQKFLPVLKGLIRQWKILQMELALAKVKCTEEELERGFGL